MNKLLIATAMTTAIATGSATPSNAQSNVAYTNNPVSIAHFSVNPVHWTSTLIWGGMSSVVIGSDITISFVNTGSEPATSVLFAVHSGRTTEIIVDKGTFSPGTSITHTFAEGPEYDGASTIEVRQVTFADGTAWQRG